MMIYDDGYTVYGVKCIGGRCAITTNCISFATKVDEHVFSKRSIHHLFYRREARIISSFWEIRQKLKIVCEKNCYLILNSQKICLFKEDDSVAKELRKLL